MPRSDDFMLTAEELRLRKRRRLRLLLLLVIVLVLGVGAFFGARPVRNEIKGWQARRHAQKAFALIEQQNWNEARAAAVAAYQLRQSEPQALRAVARFLSRTRQQQALDFWDQLAKREPLTREDRRDEITVALVSGETERAATAVNALVSGDIKDAAPRDWLLAAQVALQQGAGEKALLAVQNVLANPAARREQFQATLLQAQSAPSGDAVANRKTQTDALQRLASFAEGTDDVALDSLVLLARRALVGGTRAVASTDSGVVASSDTAAAPSSEIASSNNQDATAGIPPASDASAPTLMKRQDLIARLESHPLAKAPHKLMAIDMKMQDRPADKQSLIAEAVLQWKQAESADLAAFSVWLNGHREFQRQLDEIPLEKALGSRELFLQHVDALGALGRWEEIKDLLESERFPLDPVMQRMYLARCNAQLGQEAASKNNWQRALESAGGDVGKLAALAEYAEKNGAIEIADSAYTQVLAAAPKLGPAWQGKLRTTYASRDTKRIHEVLASMLKLWPNDPAIQNDEAYIRLLLLPGPGGTGAVPSPINAVPSPDVSDATAGVPPNDLPPESSAELIAVERLAEDLVRRFPANLPHRTLLALARLKQQRPLAALQAYDNIQAAPNSLTPSALAVHAAVLSANGERDAARNQITLIPLDRLLPEEQSGTANLRE